LSELVLNLVLFAVCSVVGIGTTALARWVSHKTGILDRPDPRKVHRDPIAYLGGMGMVMSVLVGLFAFATLAPLPALQERDLIQVFLGGLLAIYLVGLWDDVRGMKPLVKLFLQAAVAAAVWAGGVRIERVTIGVDSSLSLVASSADSILAYVIANLPSLLLTVGWFVALMNAINLIDGLDGLAGGVSLISALSLGAVGMVIAHVGYSFGMGLPFIVAGACLGFLVHNWHPAKIFMGDSGSLSIGYMLATASLVGSTKAPALLTLLLPMIALGLPLFETAFSFLRRALTGTNPFKADRRHLHHRLLDLGLSQRRVVLVFHYVTLYLGVNAVLLARDRSVPLLLNVGMIGLGLLMLIEYLSYLERGRHAASQSAAATPKTT
jgi:UDP-GlcNAc:undecaprenyl-phosphate GlcNAc-1-phosphate transferase